MPADIEPGRAFGVFADEDILILEPDAPRVDVLTHNAGWDANRNRCNSAVTPAQTHIADVPIPAWFTTEIEQRWNTEFSRCNIDA